MRPNTPHAVFTPDNAICYGNHYFSTSNLQDTLFGIIHCFVANRLITNTDHAPSRRLLQRLMAYFFEALVRGSLLSAGMFSLVSSLSSMLILFLRHWLGPHPGSYKVPIIDWPFKLVYCPHPPKCPRPGDLYSWWGPQQRTCLHLSRGMGLQFNAQRRTTTSHSCTRNGLFDVGMAGQQLLCCEFWGGWVRYLKRHLLPLFGEGHHLFAKSKKGSRQKSCHGFT